eukprot:TRINITY_DN3634_c0_g1_i2.p1 TRINITY_DN3634_c0_g1~~TRINITY_DN3634_c0_g1_i2.p1  ORF type:complete len:604 (-),score=158.56 TRINITY_DN3634_c0_g1_i2:149-1876(-)
MYPSVRAIAAAYWAHFALGFAAVLVVVIIGGVSFRAGYVSSSNGFAVDFCTIVQPELTRSPYESALRMQGVPYSHEQVMRQQRETVDEINSWMALLREALSSRPLGSYNETFYSECLASDDYFRMYADPLCTFIWAKKMAQEKIVGIPDRIEQVASQVFHHTGLKEQKPGENGGVPVMFEDGRRGWFKPCFGRTQTHEEETYRAEMYTFWFDRLLGINRTPVAMKRTLSVAHIRKLIDATADEEVRAWNQRAFQSIVVYCGNEIGTEVEGAMVGWSPFPVKLYQKKELEARFDIDLKSRDYVSPIYARLTQETAAVEKRYPLESITITFFTHLIDNIHKTGHNMLFAQRREPIFSQDQEGGEMDEALEERGGSERDERGVVGDVSQDAFANTDDGPLVLLDNDRARFDRHPLYENLCDNTTTKMIDVCRFPRSIGRRILALGFNASAADTEHELAPMPPCTKNIPRELEEHCVGMAGRSSGGGDGEWSAGASFGSLLRGLAYEAAPRGVAANGVILSCREAYFADLELQYWYNMLTRCMSLHGEEVVLIGEPWEKKYDMQEALSTIDKWQAGILE